MFHTRAPVVGSGFFHRRQELDRLAAAIARLSAGAPQWMAMLGPRKIGKTSVVLEAVRRAGIANVRLVALDMLEQRPLSPEIFRRLVLRVLDAAFGPELGESLERLMLMRSPSAYRRALQRSESFTRLPVALRSGLLEIYDGPPTPERVIDWLDLPELLAKRLGLKFVIAVDELQELGALARKHAHLFDQMRGIWQRHRNVSYFICSSARSVLLALIARETSPFFHHFAIVDLESFDQADAVDLLQSAGSEGLSISREIATKAAEIMGGHPFYLQLLGETLTQEMRSPTEAGLKEALQRLLFSPYGRLALFFEQEMRRLSGRSTFLAAALDALAGGPARLTDVAMALQTSTAATAGYIERLRDAVRRRADRRYELADPTFGLWLRWKRPGEGTLVPTSLSGNEAEQAVARALATMGFDLVYQSRVSRGAFDLLATRGGVQLGVQVKRSPLPLRFTQAEWSRLEAEARRLRWHWILAAEGADASIQMLDPAKATKGKEIRVGAQAVIENLLLWLDKLQTP